MSTSRRFSIWPNKLIMGLTKWAHGLCHGERELGRGGGNGAPRFFFCGDSWPTEGANHAIRALELSLPGGWDGLQ